MNPDAGANRFRFGITLLEVMILMAVLAVLGLLLVQKLQFRSRVSAPRIRCVNNLKQIGLSARQWAMDHGDRFPPSTALTNGGTLGHPLFAQPWIHLRALSNELDTPLVLVCPADGQAKAAGSFGAAFGRNNVSYFFGVDSDESKPLMWLAGDRNLTANGVRIPSGLYTVSTNNLLGWDQTLHNQCGNLGLADGSVQQASPSALQQNLLDCAQTNRLAMP